MCVDLSVSYLHSVTTVYNYSIVFESKDFLARSCALR